MRPPFDDLEAIGAGIAVGAKVRIAIFGRPAPVRPQLAAPPRHRACRDRSRRRLSPPAPTRRGLPPGPARRRSVRRRRTLSLARAFQVWLVGMAGVPPFICSSSDTTSSSVPSQHLRLFNSFHGLADRSKVGLVASVSRPRRTLTPVDTIRNSVASYRSTKRPIIFQPLYYRGPRILGWAVPR